MEKIELKHIAPYLPYDLRINISPKIGKGFYHGQTIMTPEEGNTGVNISLVDGKHIKPILHPLSRLTKLISHENEKFVPMKVLFGISAKDEEVFDMYGDVPEYWEQCLNVGPLFWDYYQTQKLFEWHFDVFDLIKKGLAQSIKIKQ